MPKRLAKYLADAGVGSRRQIHRLHAEGRIAVGADREYPLQSLVAPSDEILVDGCLVKDDAERAYHLLFKPPGTLTAMADPHGRSIVADLLPPTLRQRIFPVGRLDKATTGLLLLTDDGDLAQLLLHPKHAVTKRYVLRLRNQTVDADSISRIEAGVALHDGPCLPTTVEILAERPVRLALTIREGRNRIVRRMAKRVGWRLHHLHRAAVGPVTLGDIAEGDVRALSPEEVEGLYAAAGGRDEPRRRAMAALRERFDDGRLYGRDKEIVADWLER